MYVTCAVLCKSSILLCIVFVQKVLYMMLVLVIISVVSLFLFHVQIPLPSNRLFLSVSRASVVHVDAIVTWFDLHLDEDTSFSMSPAADTSWEQGIFPLSPSSSLSVIEPPLFLRLSAVRRYYTAAPDS